MALTPDEGEINGREQIIQYLRVFIAAFPDTDFEFANRFEAGNTAIDEGYLVGTHNAPLVLPTGESIAATGIRVRVRECDLVTVEDGLITSHRFYFDQVDFLGQLGLMETPA